MVMSTECCAIREGRGRGKWGVMGVMVMVWVWVWVNKNDLCVLRVIGCRWCGGEKTHTTNKLILLVIKHTLNPPQLSNQEAIC